MMLAPYVLRILSLRRLAVLTRAVACAARDIRRSAMGHVKSALKGLTNLRWAWTPVRIVNLIAGHRRGARHLAIAFA